MPSDFSSSRLVRLLGAWTPVDADAAGMDFAERLSLWVSAFDAIGLQGAQQAIRGIATAAPGPRGARPVRAETVAAEVRNVRNQLAQAIARDPLADAAEPAYAAFQQRHLELQRQMEQMVGALRDQVRQDVSRVSPALRQLAALDALFEQMLAAREQGLLPTVPLLLQRRFEQLAPVDAEALAAFVHDWRQALLAELDLRLEPVTGLVEALTQELKNRA